jgi:hypothetical protein
MFKIITLSDSNYFDCGQLFLKTRNIVRDHDIVLYGPDLTDKQVNILREHNIEYEKVNRKDWDLKMQFMKFEMILNELKKDNEKKYEGFLLSDWDVFFVNDWSHLYNYDFDLCVIARPDAIRERTLRAYGFGGGFFFKHSGKGLFEYMQKVVLVGQDNGLPEYDRIWKTLELGRPLHKTYQRTALRWWNDQVILSAIVLRFIEEKNYKQSFGLLPVFSTFSGYKIAFVSEKFYNVLNSDPIIVKDDKKYIYIRHLKEIGRIKLVGKEKGRIKEKLEV